VITGWLLKIVLVIGLIGLFAVDAGSPLIVRAQVDGAAHDAANDAAAEYLQSRNADAARAKAEADATKEGASIEKFEIDNQGLIHVTVYKRARSILLGKWNKLKSWYDVRVSVTSAGRGK
jgi:Flp pilus assembly protein TadG